MPTRNSKVGRSLNEACYSQPHLGLSHSYPQVPSDYTPYSGSGSLNLNPSPLYRERHLSLVQHLNLMKGYKYNEAG